MHVSLNERSTTVSVSLASMLIPCEGRHKRLSVSAWAFLNEAEEEVCITRCCWMVLLDSGGRVNGLGKALDHCCSLKGFPGHLDVHPPNCGPPGGKERLFREETLRQNRERAIASPRDGGVQRVPSWK